LLFIFLALLISATPGMQQAKVKKIVSGTIIETEINGKIQKVKLIGVETIAKIDGKNVENSENQTVLYIKKHLDGKSVKLTTDSKLPDKDKSGNLLRYVYFGKNKFFNLFLIKQGYALADTKVAFDSIAKFKEAEKTAKAAGVGIWGLKAVKQTASDDSIVYITKTGVKYHNKGCASLKKGSTQLKLKEAKAKGYVPCKRCKASA
jgi:micrococcal nuclease